ncbi:MAG: Phosphoserine phosphatase RsbU [Candidatus Omnitrophica bacterium ADurb.Bin314]|jgi:sigma-B regulation protein RsbU (phosphoserine phosphatase)|nr:MAG: Phosphoserine phosphatase RsbU [Candidatus Omnitrophica bacterium ADurb.Bin314]HOE68370.1 SpoIIE family protein phosphatase [Candidatus Omnitrophota bacterium]
MPVKKTPKKPHRRNNLSKEPKSCPANKVRNLQKILALNSVLNSTLELNQLLTVIMRTSAEVMRAEAASLLLIDEGTGELVFRVALGGTGSSLEEKFRVKMGEGIAGTVAKTGKPIVVNDARNDPRFAKRFDNSTGFVTKAILCVPLKAKDKVIGVLQAINPVGRKGFCLSDLDLFQTFAHQAAVAVENAKLHAEIVKQETARQALKIAHEIQQNLLPDLKNHRYGTDLFAKSIPAFDVGGDFYDVAVLDHGRISVILGDVSGKGVPAALYMVRAMSEYRFLAPQAKDPAELLTQLNRKLSEQSFLGMFITMVCLMIDPHTGSVQYSSAGHLPVLTRRAADRSTELLKGPQSVPLGLAPDAPFFLSTVKLEKHDALFLYTDGITEARNRNGKEYTVERLAACVADPAPSAEAYLDRICEDLSRFSSGAEQHDDITALAVIL